MESKNAINMLDSLIKDPSKGLSEDVFLFLSRSTPLINVDLLIKDEQNRTLMIWRDDEYCKPGWHLPGGIIRFKETIANRIRAVAKNELGVTRIEFNPVPLAINEVIHSTRKNRGHFISLLFKCSLITPPDESHHYIHGRGKLKINEWMWHSTCPDDIIEVHEMYRRFI